MRSGVKITLATFGTLGDLHPFIAVAIELRKLGWTAAIASTPNHAATVAAAGLPFHGVGPSPEEFVRELGMSAEQFARRARNDSQLYAQGVLYRHLRSFYLGMLDALSGAELVVTNLHAFAARLAAEQLGIRRVAMMLQPMGFFSAYDPPLLPEALWLARVLRWVGPKWAAAVLGRIKESVGARAGPFHGLRAELGLPRMDGDPVLDGQFSEHANIALYSQILGSVQPDYPPATSVVGFAFYDGDEQAALEPALQHFIDSGPPPLVFTLGSFSAGARGDFCAVGAEVARQLKRRAVLLVGAGKAVEQGAGTSSDVFLCPYAAYSKVFPRAEAIIHQGGIGTLAQGLRAGKPQLIVPSYVDQPDNAARAIRLGVARAVPLKSYLVAPVAKELQLLLETPRYSIAATAARERIACEDGGREAARMIVQLTARQPDATAGEIARRKRASG
jgi:rhamnosyltransferase subunit B